MEQPLLGRRHAEMGTTISVYLPPEADLALREKLLDRISSAVEEVFSERGNWDPFMVMHAGDVLQIDSDHHVYLSTSCWHDEHTYCQSNTGLCGEKVPASCKFCRSACVCPCHLKTPDQQGPAKREEEDDDDEQPAPESPEGTHQAAAA